MAAERERREIQGLSRKVLELHSGVMREEINGAPPIHSAPTGEQPCRQLRGIRSMVGVRLASIRLLLLGSRRNTRSEGAALR